MSLSRRPMEEDGENTQSDRQDQRVFCRFGLCDVPIRYKELKFGERGQGVCENISGGGAAIAVNHELQIRLPLEMWIDLPNGSEPLHVLGKVVWSALCGSFWKAGITFDRTRLMSMARIFKGQKGR